MTSTPLADNGKSWRTALEAEVRSRLPGLPTEIRALLERALDASEDDLAELIGGAGDTPLLPVVVRCADAEAPESAAL
jgi:hypothetical protein